MTNALLIQCLGLIAGLIVCAAALPRVADIVRCPQKASGESLGRNSLIVAGNLLWVVYGVLSGSAAIEIMCAINVVLNGAILWAKIHTNRQPPKPLFPSAV
jgi:uncharacterized protein with PQ loop repeat